MLHDQVIPAKTPEPLLGVEGEDTRVDARFLSDVRSKYDPRAAFYKYDQEAQESARIDEGGALGALRARTVAGAEHSAVPTAFDRDSPKNVAAVLKQRATELDLNDDDLDWS